MYVHELAGNRRKRIQMQMREFSRMASERQKVPASGKITKLALMVTVGDV